MSPSNQFLSLVLILCEEEGILHAWCICYATAQTWPLGDLLLLHSLQRSLIQEQWHHPLDCPSISPPSSTELAGVWKLHRCQPNCPPSSREKSPLATLGGRASCLSPDHERKTLFLTFHMASKNTRINSPWTVNFSLRRHKWRCEDAEHYSVLFACMRAKSWRFEHPLRAVPRLCNIHMIWIQQYVRQAVLLYKKKCLIWPSRGILKILQILKNRCTVWYPISTTMILTELYQ